MKLIVKNYDIDASEPTVLLHDNDCLEIGVKENDRVSITGSRSAVALVSRSDTLVEEGTVMMPAALLERCGVIDGGEVNVVYCQNPDSVRSIRRKMDGEKLSKEEIESIVTDILNNKLSKIEISAWLTALYINGMDIDEIADFTKAMANTGDIIEFERQPVFDFHSLGGVPGNKITPIVVSIVAAAGIMIPKLSSRAISSACGTSDFVETFCNVEMDADSLKRVSEEVGGVFAWGGAMNLAPVDDMVIKIEHPLGINPRAQMLRRGHAPAGGHPHRVRHEGSDHRGRQGLRPRPDGSGREAGHARGVRHHLRRPARRERRRTQPGGQGVHQDPGGQQASRQCRRVVEKACDCAGIILEMAGIPNGSARAREILDSGEAHRKFMEIVVAQGGRPDLKSDDLVPGQYSEDIIATKSGYIHSIHNKDVVAIAKAAGAPNDKGAGLMIYLKKGQRVEAGEKLFTIYADNEAKLRRARETAMKYPPMDIEGMLIKRVSSVPVR